MPLPKNRAIRNYPVSCLSLWLPPFLCYNCEFIAAKKTTLKLIPPFTIRRLFDTEVLTPFLKKAPKKLVHPWQPCTHQASSINMSPNATTLSHLGTNLPSHTHRVLLDDHDFPFRKTLSIHEFLLALLLCFKQDIHGIGDFSRQLKIHPFIIRHVPLLPPMSSSGRAAGIMPGPAVCFYRGN